MNFLYNIRNKGRIVILVIIVFFLVAFSSYMYNKNINEIGDLSSEMYSDRLIAQDYIYQFGKILQEKKLLLSYQNDPKVLNNSKNDKANVLTLLSNYKKTKLTKNEKIEFQHFEKNILLMNYYENKYLEASNEVSKISFLKLQIGLVDSSLVKLDKLAQIQTSSGKELNKASKKIVNFSTLLSQFDWALLIIIGLIIQVIIFTSKSTIPKETQNQFLN